MVHHSKMIIGIGLCRLHGTHFPLSHMSHMSMRNDMRQVSSESIIWKKVFVEGNAMTTSTLSACLFSLMCFALPTQCGHPIFKGPSPTNLVQISGRRPDDDGASDDEITLELPGWKELGPPQCGPPV